MSNKQSKGSSYADSVSSLLESSINALETLGAYNKTVLTDDETIPITLSGEEGDKTVHLPSYQNLIRRVESIQNSFESIVNGSGSVHLKDGSERLVEVTPIAKAPNTISKVSNPKTFIVNNNWFFEEMMFPRIEVSFNLKDKIDNFSDRVNISRIILDNKRDDVRKFYEALTSSNPLIEYHALKETLEENNISFYEDVQEVNLPLTYSKHSGSFTITNIEVINGVEWYFLSDLSYNTLDYNGRVIKSNLLNTTKNSGIQFRFSEAVYNIEEVDVDQKRVRLSFHIGFQRPAIEDKFHIYETPFKDKVVNVGIGFDEINFIFFRAVNEQYNILSPQWSNGVHFVSNELSLEGNNAISLAQFYYENVADFGSRMISELKDGKIYAYNGITPSAPSLSSDMFSVVQINTQINSTLDDNDIKQTSTNNENILSRISSLSEVINAQKIEMLETEDATLRENLSKEILTNTRDLQRLQSEHRVGIKHLQDIATKNGIGTQSAKYRIRGFFPIPNAVKTSTDKFQQIISFEVAYRYLKPDGSGTELKTFVVKNENGEQIGVYTDWNRYQTQTLEKVFDKELDMFVWKNVSISDGSEININQVDIPIQKGEKVEFKVRSISEAGYPNNPLKSQWSESIVMEFPSNVSLSSQIDSILEGAKNQSTQLQIDETLSALGISEHLLDSVGIYKHDANNILVRYRHIEGGIYDKENVTSLGDYISKLEAKLNFLEQSNLKIRKDYNEILGSYNELRSLAEQNKKDIIDIREKLSRPTPAPTPQPNPTPNPPTPTPDPPTPQPQPQPSEEVFSVDEASGLFDTMFETPIRPTEYPRAKKVTPEYATELYRSLDMENRKKLYKQLKLYKNCINRYSDPKSYWVCNENFSRRIANKLIEYSGRTTDEEESTNNQNAIDLFKKDINVLISPIEYIQDEAKLRYSKLSDNKKATILNIIKDYGECMKTSASKDNCRNYARNQLIERFSLQDRTVIEKLDKIVDRLNASKKFENKLSQNQKYRLYEYILKNIDSIPNKEIFVEEEWEEQIGEDFEGRPEYGTRVKYITNFRTFVNDIHKDAIKPQLDKNPDDFSGMSFSLFEFMYRGVQHILTREKLIAENTSIVPQNWDK